MLKKLHPAQQNRTCINKLKDTITQNKHNKSSAVDEMGDNLATIDMGQKAGGGGCCAPFHGGSWVPI